MMKRVTIAVLCALVASPALAGSWQTKCETKSVPYRATVQGGNAGNVLGGALVGGVVGKAVTGNNSGAMAGAFVGGVMANEASTKTVTRYRNVETCRKVYVPSEIYDKAKVTRILKRLNSGAELAKGKVMDVQYTIGVVPDGQWGPKSMAAAQAYLASNKPAKPPVAPVNEKPLYTLMVNDVVVVSSYDLDSMDDIKNGLAKAGVTSSILVDLQ